MGIFQGSLITQGLRSLTLFAVASPTEKSTSLANNQQAGQEGKEKH